MARKFEVPDLFVGPLPEEVYAAVISETSLFRQDRTAELAARALYGQKIAREALEDSRYDQMTSLLRRDAFLDEVNQRLSELRRHEPHRDSDYDSALFLMLDIVDLHSINNSGGHQAGDAAIQATSGLIRQIARVEGPDAAGRLGGDEFAVFIPYSRDKIRHSEMVRAVERRIEEARDIDGPGGKIPAIRYQYAGIGPNTPLPWAKELLAAADPKRQGTEPLYSYPYSSAWHAV